jgi:fructose-bisphosphate aldolase class II
MARITLRQLLDHAAEHGYGVPAFNINNMEQGIAILEAAKETDSPVIIQASRGARSYAGDLLLAKLIEGLEAQYPRIRDGSLCRRLGRGRAWMSRQP